MAVVICKRPLEHHSSALALRAIPSGRRSKAGTAPGARNICRSLRIGPRSDGRENCRAPSCEGVVPGRVGHGVFVLTARDVAFESEIDSRDVARRWSPRAANGALRRWRDHRAGVSLRAVQRQNWLVILLLESLEGIRGGKGCRLRGKATVG
jgi:hypothetical protein